MKKNCSEAVLIVVEFIPFLSFFYFVWINMHVDGNPSQ